MSRELVLIGIGAGDPDWVTVEAVRAIQRMDVLFVVLKEGELDDLVHARRVVLDRHRSTPLRTVELRDPPRPWQTAADYPAAVASWRAERLRRWTAAVAASLGPGQVGGFLVWGDPVLYESTLAIVDELAEAAPAEAAPAEAAPAPAAAALRVRVVPGISSALAIAARHRIPLNRQGRAVQITPARLLRDGMPPGVDDVVVMLDGRQTFATLDPDGLDIYWGAYLGTPDEILVSGALDQVRDRILKLRAEAAARRGWVFDTYLLRRRLPASPPTG